MTDRNTKIEQYIQSCLESDWEKTNNQITNTIAYIPMNFYVGGEKITGFVFYTKGMGMMFVPLNYGYNLVGLVSNKGLIFSWNRSSSYIEVSGSEIINL
jgi:protein associated with RNAse G/E